LGVGPLARVLDDANGDVFGDMIRDGLWEEGKNGMKMKLKRDK
jgi:hypothetical protein